MLTDLNFLKIQPRARVIVDNDFGGDPDGLFQLAHHLLSPSVEVRGVIASRHYEKGFFGQAGTAAYALEELNGLLAVLGLADFTPVFAGAEDGLCCIDAPQRTAAAEFIVKEALRTDVATPLYVACGAGMTEVASALLMEPAIAERLTVVWIGGPEHVGAAEAPPEAAEVEYNLGIDLQAAQVVFNYSQVPIWQVPRNAYRQALVSCCELRHRIDGSGKLGGFLLGKLEQLWKLAAGTLGETYILGDNPLVLLTALQSTWEVDPSSSSYTRLSVPNINSQGGYENNCHGRAMRVYSHLDTRLMLEDMYAKIAQFDRIY